MTEEGKRYAIQMMDREIAMTPMPTEYRKKRVLVRCNECRQESATPFHILRLKCRAADASCGGSYNTVKIGEAPDEEEERTTAAPLDELSLGDEEMRALLVTLFASFNSLEDAEDAEDAEDPASQ